MHTHMHTLTPHHATSLSAADRARATTDATTNVTTNVITTATTDGKAHATTAMQATVAPEAGGTETAAAT